MASDDRSRFLIALAKFLGANPTEEHPLANVIVCERWLINEVLDDIFSNEGQLRLDSAKFNRLMLNCGHGLATDHFYKHFFEGVNTLESFEGAVEAYRIKAMLLFGNFEFGYKKIATSDKNAFEALMRKTERVGADKYESRSEFLDIEDIPVEDLPLLGYISSGELDDLDFAAKLMQILLEVPDARARVLAALGVRRGKVSDLLDNYGLTFPRGQDATLDTSRYRSSLRSLRRYTLQ